MRAIEAKNVTVSFFLEGEGYVPLACATGGSVNIKSEIIYKTVVGSGRWRDRDTRLSEWDGNLTGVTHIVPLSTMYTVFDISLESIRTNGLNIQIAFVDGNSNLQVLSGHVLFPNIGITWGAEGFSEDSIEFVGNGPLTFSNTLITPPVNNNEVKAGDYTATGGEVEITLPADVIGRTLLGVWRAYPLDIITVGTPTELQVKFDSATPKLIFASTAPLSTGEYIYYQYK